ncbi:serine carboxypeptidase-like 18 isoform X2 [Gossypium arboreum]|uniref:serine carboxypeptidase-like 18 isoform X2 n=1 Tax=Gossypium arboreum TaxID=29729 RepID=UPI0022F17D46|nr:serine carboxypeptidase-like 18 isoform X2 [Gossypium arboreum]
MWNFSTILFNQKAIHQKILSSYGSLDALVANIIFQDLPAGIGFSYSTRLQGFEAGDKLFANDGYNFVRKWLRSHPKFITNSLYIAGDPYAGKIVPIIAQAISDGIKDEYVPAINLKGYLVGNPATGSKYDDNSKIPFYNLSQKELYRRIRRSEHECAKDLEVISKILVAKR